MALVEKSADVLLGGASADEPIVDNDRAATISCADCQGDGNTAPATAIEQMLGLIIALKNRSAVWRLGIMAGAIVVVLACNMAAQVWLNAWNGAFFDAVGHKDGGQIGHELIVFLGIVAVLLTLVVGQTWLHETLKVRLRESLTAHLLEHWLAPGLAYRLAMGGDVGANPDQRMQEDARNLSDLSTDLGVGLTQATMQLVCFIGVLWALSTTLAFSIGGVAITIPGYMVWCALLYAAIGSALTWFVGKPLVGLNAETYRREAEFRFGLVRASESAESIALFGGESDERRIIDKALAATLVMRRRIATAVARLTWITSGYGWLSLVVPIVVALPAYLQSDLSLGGLMMVIGAFAQVQAALRWFVDNFAKIADWRAALHRVSVFHEALLSIDAMTEAQATISMSEHPEGLLEFKNVGVQLADGTVIVAEASAVIHPGERVLLTGESGSGKSTLFRAIAGIWPWGTGEIMTPRRASMMFLPQKPYLPLGTLREALCYPSAPNLFAEQEIRSALDVTGLGEYVTDLDRVERWDQQLSLGQQQRVAFGRLILHRPAWIFLDEATSALDRDSQHSIMTLLETHLPDSAVLSIAHRRELEAFHHRTLQLVVSQEGARLARPPRPRQRRRHRRMLERLAELVGWKPAAEPVRSRDVGHRTRSPR
jgi:putative ATP-binding cassette transporter